LAIPSFLLFLSLLIPTDGIAQETRRQKGASGQEKFYVGDDTYVTRDSLEALFKVKMDAFVECLKVLTKRKGRHIEDAIDFGMYLFNYDENIIIQTSSKYRPKERTPYKIRDYLRHISWLKYERIEIATSEVKFMTELTRGRDNVFRGSCSILKSFKGFAKSKEILYDDVMKEDVAFNVKIRNQEIDGIAQKRWAIFLGNITVVEQYTK
jgi:hypothetical protein